MRWVINTGAFIEKDKVPKIYYYIILVEETSIHTLSGVWCEPTGKGYVYFRFVT